MIMIALLMFAYVDNRFSCERQLATEIELKKKIQDLGLSLYRKPFSQNYERITPGIFVTGKLRKNLLEAGVSGIKFEKVAAS